MSIAGRRALEGFTYQSCVALYWLIEMIHQDRDNPIEVVSVDSVGLADAESFPDVDDIVIRFESGKTLYVQAKKNQPNRVKWSLSDSTIQNELCSARDQLEKDDNARVRFYSRTPFGELSKLAEACRNQHPNYDVFAKDPPKTLSKPLGRLSSYIDRTEREAFDLICRIEFKLTPDLEEWSLSLLRSLDQVVSDSQTASFVLKDLLEKHTSGHLETPQHEISRRDAVESLESAGVRVTPKRPAEEILEAFDTASQIGRSWLRKIDGEHLPRKEVENILNLVQQNTSTVLVKGRPGSGKTCVLLDLVECIEEKPNVGRLFIKGDRFCNASSEKDLADQGLPKDIPGQCARLAKDRPVVVIIDALDVLSINRHHNALKVFLGLIEQLEILENVTTVAACRVFDLKYDPLLRGREWDKSVTVKPLDFEEVAPFLKKWEIDPSAIGEDLQEILRIPQNLNLYSRIARQGGTLEIGSTYQLQERFLQEIVIKDDLLGESALDALQGMAARLVENRSQEVLRAAFDASEPVIRRLVSQEVLSESSNGSLAFTHQTLGDNLAVRKPIAEGQTLQEYILTHSPLPFIRPSVRSFFFYLRANEPNQFRKQVWEVVTDGTIAYHLRRLVVESISEIEPIEGDWPLIRRLFKQEPDLFYRLFNRLQGEGWFDLLHNQWLPLALSSSDDGTWPLRFVNKIHVWASEYPDEIVSLWRRALDEGWDDFIDTAESIVGALDQVDSLAANTDGLEDLLRRIVNGLASTSHSYEYTLGRLISRWIEEANRGDDILWEYVTKDVTKEDFNSPFYVRSDDFYLDFHRDDFLKDRLCTSDSLLTTVIDAIENWSKKEQERRDNSTFRRSFLRSTSWEAARSDQDQNYISDLDRLFRAAESALKHRASRNDDWWQANEPQLRSSFDLALRYLTIQAYRSNVADNLNGIVAQVCDFDLLRHSGLDYEISCLMQESYPQLDRSTRKKNQKVILSLRNDFEENGELESYRAKTIYDYLNRIPRCFRERESQKFVQKWESTFGTSRSGPRITSYGGTVGYPVAPTRLLSLSSDSLIRLSHHFNGITNSFRRRSGGLSGGREMLQSSLSAAAALDPCYFLPLLPRLQPEELDPGYIQAVFRGFANHIRFRFGNLNRPSDDWQPIHPAPSKTQLAWKLIELAETTPELWKDGNAAKRVVRACSDVVENSEFASRLIVLVFRLLQHRYESNIEVDSLQSAQSADLNHVHGAAAESGINIWYQLYQTEGEQPELLPHLLMHCAKHESIAARAAILRRLPYLIQEQPSLGWPLFEAALEDAPPFLWGLAEKTLYYNYHDDYDRVSGYLNRIRNEAIDLCGETYGRILTLSHLAGHISQDDLFGQLETANEDSLKGAMEVFTANLNRQTSKCTNGAIRLLRSSQLTPKVWETFTSRSFQDDKLPHISQELAEVTISSFPPGQDRGHFYDLSDWIARKSRLDPHSALDVMESLVSCIDQNAMRWAVDSEALMGALLSILREADEYGDEGLVNRSIALQDRLLQMNLPRVDKLLDEASRDW